MAIFVPDYVRRLHRCLAEPLQSYRALTSRSAGRLVEMSETPLPPLKFLHAESSLSQAKLDKLRRIATEDLVESLQPGRGGSLKARPDGTILDGHHRCFILQERGIAVDQLPRQTIVRVDDPG